MDSIEREFKVSIVLTIISLNDIQKSLTYSKLFGYDESRIYYYEKEYTPYYLHKKII